MILLSYSLKNLFRNKKRTILSILGISISLACLLVISGYYEYNYWGLRESSIRSQYGHIQISKKDYYEHKNSDPFLFTFDNYDELISQINSIPDVEVVSERLEFLALLESQTGKSKEVMVRGIIPSKENEFNTFFSKKDGKYLTDNDYGSAELGLALAKNLELNTLDYFTLEVVDSDGFINAQSFQAKSFIGSYSEDFDSRIVRIHLNTAKSLYGVNGVHEIAIILNDTSHTDNVYKIISNMIESGYPELSVTTWKDHSTYYNQVVQFYSGYYRIILLIICAVVFLSAFNTIMLGANERLLEFGTMQSFGLSKKLINAQIIIESLILAFVSLFVSFIISLLITSIINGNGGIHISPPPGVSSDVYVHIRLTVSNILTVILLGVSASVVSSVFTMVKISSKTIIELLNSSYR